MEDGKEAVTGAASPGKGHREAAPLHHVGTNPVGAGGATPSGEPVADGRNTRWARHRVQKRRELVAATLRAIRRHGAGVGLDDIAAQAGTSKTVIYRYFGDRTGLWAAVVESVHDYIISNLDVPLTLTRTNPVQLVVDLTDAYLSVVERDPEIYRFVVNEPAGDNPLGDPVATVTRRIGTVVSDTIRTHLRSLDMPEDQLALADTWGHGVVGFIWAVADNWLATGMRRPRAEVVADISTLLTPALQPISPGVQMPPSTLDFLEKTRSDRSQR